MQVDVLYVGPMDNCTYLLSKNGQALLVDPAWEMTQIEQVLTRKNLQLAGVLYTHGHFDHVKFSHDLLVKMGVKGYLEKNDWELSGLDSKCLILFAGSQTFKIGPFTAQAITTPGHTAGGVCWLVEGVLFTGDTLFPGACGRVDLPTSDPRAMLASLRKLAAFPDDTVIFSGHNYGGRCRSTIGMERLKNPFMRNAVREGEGHAPCTF